MTSTLGSETTTGNPRVPALLTRSSAIGLADQVLSSISTFLPGLFAAHVLSPREFGVFAVVQAIYVVALGITRASFSEVALVGRDSEDRAGSIAAVASAGASMALVTTALLGMITDIGYAPLALVSAGIVSMLVQDAMRLAAIGDGRPHLALLNDAAWVVSVIAALAFLTTSMRDPTPLTIAATWGLTSLVGVLLTGSRVERRPTLPAARIFVRRKWKLSLSFVGDFLARQGVGVIATNGVGILGGLSTIAGVRAALLLLGPLNIAFTGVQLVASPMAVRLQQQSRSEFRALLRNVSILLAVAAAAAGCVVWLLPHPILEALVDEQVDGARRFVLPLATLLLASGLTAGSNLGLRVLHAGGRIIQARVASTLLVLLPTGLSLAFTRSPVIVLWVLAVTSVLTSAIWVSAFRDAAACTDRSHDATP